MQGPPRSSPEASKRRNDNILNTDLDENRGLAAHLLGTLQSTSSYLLNFAADVGKWMLTSLLAINGGALVAVWPVEMVARDKAIACALFVAGIFAALGSGMQFLRAVETVNKPLGEAIGYWMSVQVDGLRASELESFEVLQNATKRFTSWATSLGWLSAAFFLAGVVIAGLGSIQFQASKPPAASATPAITPSNAETAHIASNRPARATR